MAALYPNLGGWIRRPAPFRTSKHGTLAEFLEEGSVAERLRSEDFPHKCVVYTAQPLMIGEVWVLMVLSTTDKWAGGLVSGWMQCFTCGITRGWYVHLYIKKLS